MEMKPESRSSATLTAGMPVVSFQAVSKDYLADGQKVRALDNLSLGIEEGEFVALVGRSGCGKSTLLNLAGAMDFPTSGRVLLDGTPTSSLNDSGLTCIRREKVGFIFQSFQLLPTLSAIENVELPLLLAGSPTGRTAAREMLGWWNSPDAKIVCRISFPAGRCSAWPSPAHSSIHHGFCLPTNRPGTSIQLP